MARQGDPFGNKRPLRPITNIVKTNNTKENKDSEKSKKEEQPKITIHIDNINIYLNKGNCHLNSE